MNVIRTLDAFCVSCDEVVPHAVVAEDPGACFCDHCGRCQLLPQPLNLPLGPPADDQARGQRTAAA